ncbi:MAG: Trk family potassium uptake protein [Ruminococcaceae bacterium]|nr:Trk family potassium uptake protein [Oscillospiraceae bacterium]
MKRKFKIFPAQVIVLGFLGIILLGTVLLCLPFASAEGSTGFVDALFTATSATCVTGLVSLTTATHWTLFGKIVILALIQIGGLGFMSFISITAIIAKKNIGLQERKLIMQSSGSIELSEIYALIKRIVFGTLIVEGCGAIILSIRFWIGGMSFGKGLWFGIFHAISAFCNAGFDILGAESFECYQSDPVVLITVSLLIIIGGIGFLVWGDFTKHGFKLKNYRLHSKLVIVATAVLLLGGTLLLYLTENSFAFAHMTEGEKWLNAFFQSVTLRTAGFASVNQATLSSGGTVVSCIFMLIGGSPGSTAGGIKTITFAVMILNAIAFARNKDSVTVFKKRIEPSTIKHACAIIAIYLAAACTVIVAIAIIEGGKSISLEDIVFEVFSAVGTVGLTRGITPLLATASKLLLCLTMFFGRMGGLTLLLAIAENHNFAKIERPYEKILIG